MRYEDKLYCPHCGVEQEDPIGDYTIPGKVGHWVVDECEECYRKFKVAEVSRGEFFVVEKE